ncbi:DUF3533 domain-containing protein [Nocardia otitidiscaviarum]|uniref:DUF3533 domain-containing protein n=1 Tax=Nocardia otitidiscaviarum TaxID=1823 RepID=A0A516NLV0_9NOCA|nr:DUF3533 domain-containing protein [Nocardia otitidiscaviarum]MCP9624719.1 SNG1 family protein [Nocardia otitidiscaviarum]QDP79884.1 DUF3533 domain-containing protein [Nocardia otitidiscaviarum]
MPTDAPKPVPPRREHQLWAVPLLVAMGLLSLLALSYLASILDPQRNLHDFPLLLVNEDRGEYGAAVADTVTAGLRGDQVSLRATDAATAESVLSAGKAYAAIVIPADFSTRMSALEQPTGVGAAPVVEIRTNPRTGATAVSLAARLVHPVLERANRELGADVLNRARANGVPLTDAARITLAEPIRVSVVEFHPLPAGSANGISAFYYTLLVVFAGFTGSLLINGGVDAAVAHDTGTSRWRVLLYKWGLAAVVAVVMAGVYQLIAAALGMPMDHRAALYLFSAYAALAIGMTAMTILTMVATAATALRLPVLNTLGMPINMLLFLALGLPSSGGIVPIEATPPAYGVLSRFEPMHQVYLGIRSILYFDARADAGLTRAVGMCTLGVAIAVGLGVATTLGYDRLRARTSAAAG